MLPHFPKAARAMQDIFHSQVFDGLHEAAPMLLKIPIRPQREGHEGSFQDESGEVHDIEFQRQQAVFNIKTEEARGLTPKAFVEAARQPGRELGMKIAKDLYASVGAAAEAVGNVVKADGEFTFDLLLDCLRTVKLDFLPDGKARFPELHLGPAAFAEVQRKLPEWNSNPECRARFDELMRRKKEEFLEREACRRLVD